MAIIVPTYTELYNSIITDLKNKLGINSLVGKMVLPAIASVYAAKQKLQYIQIARVNQNIYPDLADEETLRRCGRIRLLRDIRPAVAGEYSVTVSGTIGSVISIGTTYANQNGYLYIVDTEFTFIKATGLIQVRALTVGSESSLQIGDSIQLTAPLTNVDLLGEVFTVVTIPTIAETVEEYRVNVINSFRLQSQGGSRADYRIWTESVPGVREVYPYVKQNYAGEINLYIEAFVDDSTDGKGTPTPAILAAVLDAIEPSKIPMTVCSIHYLAINTINVDVIIDNISDISKLAEITASVTDFLYNIRPFVGGADIAADVYKGRFYASNLIQLVIDSGVSFDDVTVEVNSTPITSYEFTGGDIPYLNSVTNV